MSAHPQGRNVKQASLLNKCTPSSLSLIAGTQGKPVSKATLFITFKASPTAEPKQKNIRHPPLIKALFQ